MIPKQELLQMATNTNLSAQVIEKDYLLGWLLAGIGQHEVLGKSWVFKGGTCLKKCYFETYRFSEDLDFTLQNKAHLEIDFLKSTFSEIADWIYDMTGMQVHCYSYVEVFAEKTRALAERTRPRDLYDVIHFYRRPESNGLAMEVKRILEYSISASGASVATL